jgi:hypothetical protein
LDVSGVKDFSFAFSIDRNEAGGTYVPSGNPKAATFVGTDISKWITTSVTSLKDTFAWAGEMNADLSGWSVVKVTTLENTFYGASEFVGTGLSSWITTSITTLSYTFFYAGEMNADLSGWNVAKVDTMYGTFDGASKFAGVGLDSWDVSKVSDMTKTFTGATSLTSCSKRKIADAWKSNSAFLEQSSTPSSPYSWNTAWAGETCPKVREDVV